MANGLIFGCGAHFPISSAHRAVVVGSSIATVGVVSAHGIHETISQTLIRVQGKTLDAVQQMSLDYAKYRLFKTGR
jgi:hypothetical protein